MSVNFNDRFKTCERCMERAPLRYDEPLKGLTFSPLWQQVVMDTLYMPKIEDGYHLLVVAREYLSAGAEVRPDIHHSALCSAKMQYFQ